jgi:Arc/MetJ-type ribon-helix-helix transcriptional regulator
MEQIAPKKLHVAPLARQARAIEKLLKQGRYRNVTEFLRAAIDHYLDHLGRPSLSEQARQMAEDFQSQRALDAAPDPYRLQRESMRTDEDW